MGIKVHFANCGLDKLSSGRRRWWWWQQQQQLRWLRQKRIHTIQNWLHFITMTLSLQHEKAIFMTHSKLSTTLFRLLPCAYSPFVLGGVFRDVFSTCQRKKRTTTTTPPTHIFHSVFHFGALHFSLQKYKKKEISLLLVEAYVLFVLNKQYRFRVGASYNIKCCWSFCICSNHTHTRSRFVCGTLYTFECFTSQSSYFKLDFKSFWQ